MNDKAVELILSLNHGGRPDDYIINTLMYNPDFRLAEGDAISLVAETLKKKEEEVSRSLVDFTRAEVPSPLDSLEPSTSSSDGVLETEDDGWFSETLADGWSWLDKATDDTWAEGAADFFVNQARVFKAGRIEGGEGDELIDALDGEGDFEGIANAMRRVDQMGMSQAAKDFNEAISEEGLGFFDKLAIFASSPAAGAEVLSNSFGRMLGSGTEASGVAGAVAMGSATAGAYALAGAGAGSVVPGAGTAVGATGGGIVGFGKGVMGGVSGMVDAHATIMEILREELQVRDLEINGENIEKIFNDEAVTSRMRNQAIARGLTIAVFDSLVAAGTGSVVGAAAKSGSKVLASSAGKQAAGLAFETGGAMLGEASAQLVSTGEIDAFEAVLEGIAEIPMSGVSVAHATVRQGKYSINGQEVNVTQAEEYIASGQDLSRLEIKRDGEMSERVQKLQGQQKPKLDETRSQIELEAKKNGLDLGPDAMSSAMDYAFANVQEAKANGNETLAAEIVTKSLAHAQKMQPQSVAPLNIDEQSSGQRATVLSSTRYSAEGKSASDLEAKAASNRKKAMQAVNPSEKARFESLAQSQDSEAKSLRTDMLERYRKMVLTDPDKAKALQVLDQDINNLQTQLRDPNVDTETRVELEAELERKTQQRVEVDESFDAAQVVVDRVQATTDIKEQAAAELQSLFQKEKELKGKLKQLRAEDDVDVDAISEIEADLQALTEDRKAVGDAVNTYNQARAEYDAAENAAGTDIERGVLDAAQGVASVLGVEMEVEAETAVDTESASASWSAEAQAENHFADPPEDGTLGSTYTLDGKNQIGQPKAAVSIFNERSRIIEGKLTKDEMVKVLNEFKEANADILEANGDILSIGTYFDPTSNQTFIDVSAIVDKEAAVALGKEYNQESVFALDTFENIKTGGDGTAIEGLKPEIDRVADIRRIVEKGGGKAAEAAGDATVDAAKKAVTDDLDELDRLVEETRDQAAEAQQQPSSKYPDGAIETPRAKDGSSNWREGMGGLTAEDAGVLNRFQKLSDSLGLNVVVYPDATVSSELDGGKHGSTWGGLYTSDGQGARTIHINPSQIRENQRIESESGAQKTKSFKETVQEEVMHAVLGATFYNIFKTNPAAAIKLRKSIEKIASGNEALMQRVNAKEATYRSEGVSEAEVFEEVMIEMMSAYASGDVDVTLIDKIRIAINKALIMYHGATGREMAITNTDSMQSIIAKFAMAQNQGITFGSKLETQPAVAMASKPVSPASLAKNEDGTVTVEYNKPIYKWYGPGDKKDIGSQPVKKQFRDQWHFINWWKKVTNMGTDMELSGFKDVNGNPIDVDRIKGYKGSRASARISTSPVKEVGMDLNRMVAAAQSQGLISGPVASAVRRKTAPLLRKIEMAERRGEGQPKSFDKMPHLKDRLEALRTHVEGIIQREAKAKGKEFQYGGDQESRASQRLFETQVEVKDGFTPNHVEVIRDNLAKIGIKTPEGRVAAYDAMRQYLAEKYPDGSKDIFIGAIADYLADPQLMVEKFGAENPLEFFSNYHAEAEAKVNDAMKRGVITGSKLDNMAKMNFFAALVSAKNQSKPNMEAVLQMMVESEGMKVDGPSGITEGLAKMVASKKIKGASGIGVKSYAVAIRKFNAIIEGKLDVKGISPTFKQLYNDWVANNGPFVREDGEIAWTNLTRFLGSKYTGQNVIERTMAQALFGFKVGAWTLNMNQELFPNMRTAYGKLGDVVTVDTHVLNSTQLALGTYEGAETMVMQNYVRLVSKLKDLGVSISSNEVERKLTLIGEALPMTLVPTSLRTDQAKAEIRTAALAVMGLVNQAENHIAFLEAEGRFDDANSLLRILDSVENPTITESNSKKLSSQKLVQEMAATYADTFTEMDINPSKVGQLIFADRQVFAGAKDQAIFDAEGNLKPSSDYNTYAGALAGLPPMEHKRDARASQLVLFPTKSGKQEATESNLYRRRSAEEALSVLRGGQAINNKVVDDALSTDATSRRIIAKGNELEVGQKVGVRLNLNVMKNTGVPVQTMHNKTATGEALKYAGAVMVKNPALNVNQNARKKIVTFQENKFPMASVDGEFLTDNIDLMNFDGVKAFFNPFKQNVFVDAAGRPIKSAGEATIVGNTVYLRGDIEYYGFSDPILEQGRKETAEERAKRVKRGPKYEKALKRFKAMAERNGVEFASNLDVEMAYDNMPIESKVALNESEVAANMEEAQKRASSRLKVRQTAGRQARKYPSVRAEILGNPENYFTPQTLKDIKGDLYGKTDAELVGIMKGEALGNLQSRNDDLGVLATAELISRAVGRGDMDAVPYLVSQAAQMGTTAGRILRHLRELKSSTPQGLVAVIEGAVGKRGNKLSAEQKGRLEKMAAKLYQLQAEHEDLVRRAIAGEDVETDLKSKVDEVKAAERELDTFTNGVIERGWGEIGTMLIQGNLLTPMSQITNVGANMVNALGKVAVDAIALPVEKLINAFGIESDMKRNYSINAYMYGLRKFGQGFVEALDTIMTGQEAEVTEWRMHRGFAPFRSLMSAMGKGELPLGPDGTVSTSQRVKLAVQGTLGVPAETMFRFLSLGDTPFRRYVEGIELYHAGRSQGLEGEALAQFMKHPTKRARMAAETEGRKLTFQERTVLSELAEDSIGFMERAISKGMSWVPGLDEKAFAKFIVRSNMPYVRTPANMLMETLKYVSPYVAGPSILKHLADGDARSAAQDFGKIVTGTIVSQTAVTLIREGLISEGLDWTDDEKKNISYDQFPPNSINVTGLKRWLRGEDPSHQTDDVFVGYNKLGILGAVIGATAKSVDREELRSRDEEGFALHALQDVFGVGAFSGITYMMDQSFMQGMSTLLDVIGSADVKDLERSFEKWTKTTFQAVSATALPNTLSALYRGTREYMPDTRVTKDMSTSERILAQMAYTIKDRTFNLGDLPVRVDWKGNPVKQTPRGTTGIAYQIFDITKSRQGEADAVSNEIYRLYEQTEQLTRAVGTPGYAEKRKLNVPNMKEKHLRALRLKGIEYPWMKDEEFMADAFYLNTTQMNRLMEASGKERYQELEALINSNAYQAMDDEERVAAMDKINDNYNSAVEYRGGNFRNHSLMLFEIMQEVYENERAED